MCLLAGIGDLKDQQSECLLISRMLTNHTVDFLWNTGSDWPGWPAQDNKTTVFNRYCRAGFTSKVLSVPQMLLIFMNINFQFTHNDYFFDISIRLTANNFSRKLDDLDFYKIAFAKHRDV